jgi:hypothetical protein
MYDYVMRDIDNIKPTFYRYKTETTEFVEGFETKYRPNMHLGVILDESPDYIQDNAFSGIDVYSIGVLGLTAAKYNRKEIQELKANLKPEQAVGKGKVAATEKWIEFSAEFSRSLQGREPIVNITATSQNSGHYISQVTDKGFRVVGNSPFTFNWHAMTAPTEQKEAHQEDNAGIGSGSISSSLLESLKVPESKKRLIQDFNARQDQKRRQERQDDLNKLQQDSPKIYQDQIKEERSNQQLKSITGGE